MSIRRLRLAAALLPTALILHELTYAISGGGDRGSHTYLDLALPILVAIAVAIAAASLVLPLLGRGAGERGVALAPFGIAGALLAVFAGQELAEAVLLGGGAEAFAAALASAWLLVPVSLLLGLAATGVVHTLDRTEDLFLATRRRRPGLRYPRFGAGRPSSPRFSFAISPLAFGLARRPPPAPVSCS